MRHHSAVSGVLVLPPGYVAAGYTFTPLKAQLMGCISFSGPPVAHPLDFWDADGMNVTIAEDNGRKGKIIQKNSKG